MDTLLEGQDARPAGTPVREGVVIVNGHGIDHTKTVSGKGSCQPGYAGKPFTCLCGIGPMTLPELYEHMTGKVGLAPGSQEWMDQADVAALNNPVSDGEKAEAKARLDRRFRRARSAA